MQARNRRNLRAVQYVKIDEEAERVREVIPDFEMWPMQRSNDPKLKA